MSINITDRNSVQELLQNLLQFNSNPSNPRELERCREYLKKELRAIETTRGELTEIQGNLIFDTGVENDETLAILLHYDVIKHDNSCEFKIEDGFYIGTGVTSAKGAIAAIIVGLEELNNTEKHIKLILTKDETTGSHEGTKYLVNNHEDVVEADHYWIPDCTDQYISIGNYHILAACIRVKGDGGHPAYDTIDRNTNVECIKVVNSIEEIIEEYKSRYGDDLIANITTINSGEKPNMVPKMGEITVEFRLHPTHDYEVVEESLKNRLENISPSINFDIKELPGFLIESPNDVELIQKLRKKQNIPVKIEKGNHDGAVIGYKMGKPIIGFLPGGESLHTPQEKVKIENISNIKQTLIELVASEGDT